MEVKDRVILQDNQSHEDNRIVIDEYGVQDGQIYHRNIAINEAIYKPFEKDPDEKMLLDAFLERHDISKEWKRYDLHFPTNQAEIDRSSRIFANIDLGHLQNDRANIDEQTKSAMYHKVYEELSERESLVNNPSIMAIINEAIREDSEWSAWESVFPFFQ